jgi:hypothetical protein
MSAMLVDRDRGAATTPGAEALAGSLEAGT